MATRFTSPPAGVGIQLVEAGDSRTVMVIPPGGSKGKGIGCFALIWNAICIPMGIVLVFFGDSVQWEGGEPPPFWGILLFFSLFWAVGLGVLVMWLRMRFTRILLSLESQQLSIQRSMLGWKKLSVVGLDDNSYAELVTSYEENDVPVYCVCIHTAGEDEKFGTALSRPEKEWIVETINRWLGYGPSTSGGMSGATSRSCPECGGELLSGEDKRVCADCGSVYQKGQPLLSESASDADSGVKALPSDTFTGRDDDNDVTSIHSRPAAIPPWQLSPDSKITVESEAEDELVFSYRIELPFVVRLIGGVFLTIFCSIWYGVLITAQISFLGGAESLGIKIGLTAFLLLFAFAGLMPLSILLALFMGNARLSMNPSNLTGSIGFWIIRKKKQFPMSSIVDVGVGTALAGTSRTGRQHTQFEKAGAILHTTEMNLPLTISSDEQFNREVAGLVRYQLERMGIRLTNG